MIILQILVAFEGGLFWSVVVSKKFGNMEFLVSPDLMKATVFLLDHGRLHTILSIFFIRPHFVSPKNSLLYT